MGPETLYPEGWLGEVTDWQEVEANRITYAIGDIAVIGKVLIGPHEVGAQAFIPPRVYCNTPENFGATVNDKGWRHGIWTRLSNQTVAELHELGTYPINGDETNLVWVDGTERPLQLTTVGLKKADELIEESAPAEHSDFAKEATVSRAQRLRLKSQQDDPTFDQEQKREAALELRQLTAETAAAFGSDWVKQNIIMRRPDL